MAPLKPRRATEYTPDLLARATQTLLHLATVLGDFIDDTVIVGGLAPSLLIDLARAEGDEGERHPGTTDVDVGFSLAIFDEARYQAIADRLAQTGFEPDKSDKGFPTRQRWLAPALGSCTIDFLIATQDRGPAPGKLQDLTPSLAAISVPGLELAFADRRQIALAGETLDGGRAERSVWVAGPASLVVMKALAFRIRGYEKDAYDLFYVLRNTAETVEAMARALAAHPGNESVAKALAALAEDFGSGAGLGPVRAALFARGGADDEMQADVAGYCARWVTACRKEWRERP